MVVRQRWLTWPRTKHRASCPTCPHYAGGNAAETVVPFQQVNNPGVVSGVIYINDANCAIAYENEAANSHGHWVPDANGDGSYQWVWPVPVDPYGRCAT